LSPRKPKPHSIGVPDEKWQKCLKLFEDEQMVWELLLIDTPSKLYNLINGFGPDRILLLVEFVKKLRATAKTP